MYGCIPIFALGAEGQIQKKCRGVLNSVVAEGIHITEDTNQPFNDLHACMHMYGCMYMSTCTNE